MKDLLRVLPRRLPYLIEVQAKVQAYALTCPAAGKKNKKYIVLGSLSNFNYFPFKIFLFTCPHLLNMFLICFKQLYRADMFGHLAFGNETSCVIFPYVHHHMQDKLRRYWACDVSTHKWKADGSPIVQ